MHLKRPSEQHSFHGNCRPHWLFYNTQAPASILQINVETTWRAALNFGTWFVAMGRAFSRRIFLNTVLQSCCFRSMVWKQSGSNSAATQNNTLNSPNDGRFGELKKHHHELFVTLGSRNISEMRRVLFFESRFRFCNLLCCGLTHRVLVFMHLSVWVRAGRRRGSVYGWGGLPSVVN